MVILYSVVLIGMGLVVDLLYAWLDPRVRYER
jgi:ABC-type dipeptide/oligopeptide/nickel transport system permease component